MIRPEMREWNSLANLIVSGNDFSNMIVLLKRTLAEQDVRNRHLEGVALHRGQGVSLILADLVQAIENAPEIVKESRRHGRS